MEAGLPWKSITLGSGITAYSAVSSFSPRWSSTAFTGYFVSTWVLSFVAWACWKVILWPKVFSPLRGLPEPKNDSFFNGQWEKIRKLPNGVPMQQWIATIPNDGLIRYLGLLNQERLLIASPKALAEVLVTKNYDFQKPALMRLGLARILGYGILMTEGEEHKIQRRNLMPAFAFRHVKDLYPIFWSKAAEGVQAMTRQLLLDAAKDVDVSMTAPAGTTPVSEQQQPFQANGNNSPETEGWTGELEVGVWASRITLDIIGIAGMGRDFGAIADPTNPLFQTYNVIFKPSRQAQLLNLLGLFIPTWLLTRLPVQRNADVKGAAQTIRSTCAELIREKKQKLARKELTDVDILSVALESGGFSDDNLIDQLMTFLAAGHETTASSMTWAIYLLCRYPEIQTRLRQEVRERLPSIDDASATITSMDIDRMPYLNAVCSEVLRYFSPVPMTLREAAVETSIQGVKVPKGTRIILAASGTNRDPALWGSDSNQFNPDRWLSKHDGDKNAASGGATSNYALLTFLHGPRSCIGASFAKAEFACLLATWIGKMKFELKNPEDADEDKLEIKGGVTQRPAKGMHVKVKVLDGW
ncbi:cytochrome P450 [Coniella lustricola]|uniref:Cytochrome P450 n=1 Tax=Coniella lustricola TaxID=2025994 RepID=A0A2T3AIX1_9PEZI|nr:cytochrome P450 [Coniella lustricola]